MARHAPLWTQGATYPASYDRDLPGALWPTARCDGAGAGPGASGGMSIDVQPGRVAVPTSNNTGSALCRWDGPETLTLTPSPPAGSNRIDRVVCQLRAADIDGGTDPGSFVVSAIDGAIATSPAVPVAPATPANAVALWDVYVGGGVATLVPANFTSQRPSSLVVPAPVTLPPSLLMGVQDHTRGSIAAGTSNGPTRVLPTPTVPSLCMLLLGGQQGFGAAATTANYGLVRADNQQEIFRSGAFQAAAATTTPLPSRFVMVNLAAGQSLGLYINVTTSGSNNYFNPYVGYIIAPT